MILRAMLPSRLDQIKHHFVWRRFTLEFGIPLGLFFAIKNTFFESHPNSSLGGLIGMFIVYLVIAPLAAYMLARFLWWLGLPQKFLPFLDAELNDIDARK